MLKDTVDGSEILHQLRCKKNLVNYGINYQLQLVSRIVSINSMIQRLVPDLQHFVSEEFFEAAALTQQEPKNANTMETRKLHVCLICLGRFNLLSVLFCWQKNNPPLSILLVWGRQH